LNTFSSPAMESLNIERASLSTGADKRPFPAQLSDS
jgi:hypothetical protein